METNEGITENKHNEAPENSFEPMVKVCNSHTWTERDEVSIEQRM